MSEERKDGDWWWRLKMKEGEETKHGSVFAFECAWAAGLFSKWKEKQSVDIYTREKFRV